ncbi:hypothetical protein [Hyphococcus sp.]|jgi:hypothetical protein|uniref:hypothetical protein n=1 Tax=Hyphococcus sp. TaxID=2038636 RepID=UPI003D0AC6B2
MSAFAAYILGAIVLAVGLGIGAHLLGVPPLWIGVGALVILGAGIMSAAAKTKRRDAPEHS